VSEVRTLWGPLAGMAYVVLVVPSLISVGVTPSVDKPVGEIISFYRDNNTSVLIGSVGLGVAAVAFLFFIGFLRSVLNPAERGMDSLRAVAFAGGTVAAVGMLIFAALGVALADGADDVEPAALEAINALNVHMYLPLAGGIVTFLIATGLVAMRTTVVPRWLAWAAIIIAFLAFTPVSFFAFLGSIPWVLAISAVLLRNGAGRDDLTDHPGSGVAGGLRHSAASRSRANRANAETGGETDNPRRIPTVQTDVDGRIPLLHSLGVVFAATVVASVHVTAISATPTSAAVACQPDLVGTHLWLSLRPDLEPASGSPAAFRLADQRSVTLWENSQPDLQPTDGSPAAFRLAEQHDVVAAATACLYD
jgi:hypothetical protein